MIQLLHQHALRVLQFDITNLLILQSVSYEVPAKRPVVSMNEFSPHLQSNLFRSQTLNGIPHRGRDTL